MPISLDLEKRFGNFGLRSLVCSPFWKNPKIKIEPENDSLIQMMSFSTGVRIHVNLLGCKSSPKSAAKIPRGFTLSSFATLLGCTHRGVVGPRWGDEVDTHFQSAIASMRMVYLPTWRVQFRCFCSSTKTPRNQTTGMFMQWLHSPEKLCEGFKMSAFFVAWPGGQFVVVFLAWPFLES